MLIYHPAFDINHGLHRLLVILELLDKKEVSFDLLRLLDFYYLFPAEILKIRLPQGSGLSKTPFRKYKNPYDDLRDSKSVFMRLESYQWTSIKLLVSRGILELEPYRQALAKRSEVELHSKLSASLRDAITSQSDLLKFLTDGLTQINFSGVGGLKDRTGLFEYKYDII